MLHYLVLRTSLVHNLGACTVLVIKANQSIHLVSIVFAISCIRLFVHFQRLSTWFQTPGRPVPELSFSFYKGWEEKESSRTELDSRLRQRKHGLPGACFSIKRAEFLLPTDYNKYSY